jgi:integration host factor subunit alpha
MIAASSRAEFSLKRLSFFPEPVLIKRSLESGEDVLVSGFGKFKVREKKARKGRNPATGEGVILDPRRVVTFHCSGKLRKKINQ